MKLFSRPISLLFFLSILLFGSFIIHKNVVFAVENTKVCPFNFTRELKTGMVGEDVRELQKYLNNNGFILTNEGPGSLGNETTMFGAFTRTALTNFQKVNNIVAVYGVFDISTGAYLGCKQVETTKTITTGPISFIFTRNLNLGMVGEDVRDLQKYLNNNGFLISETGAGSKGNETTYFGLKTKQALIRFQEQNYEAILKPFGLTSGTGNLYLATRNFINKSSSAITTTPSSIPSAITTVVSTEPVHDNPFAPFYTITYIPGFGGTVTGVSPQNIKPGGRGTAVTAKPYNNYTFVEWSDGVKTPTRIDTNVTGYKTVTAKFVGNQSTGGSSWGGGGGGGGGGVSTYTLTYYAESNGSISGTVSQTVNSGGSGSLITAVPSTGYHFVSWSDGVTTAERTDINITSDKSVTATFAINEQLTTPIFTPNSGAIAIGASIIQIDSDAGSTIYYTTDGSDPTTASSHINTGETITLSSVVNPIKAYAVKADYPDSAIGTSGVYTQDATANLSALSLSNVTISPTFAGGTYTYTSFAVANAISSTRVTATGLGTLQMSVDYGASTTITTSVQSGALSLTAGATSTILVSSLETGKTGKTYLVNVYRNYPAQATPTFSPVAGAIALGSTVTITSAGADNIYYTTNGDDPTTSDPSISSGGTVTISSVVTLKALAVKSGYDNSAVGSATYTQSVSNNASNIALSGSPTGYTFAAGTYSYTGVGVDNAVSSITITPTAVAGTITVEGVTVASGVASDPISLTAGVAKAITVVVTETGKSAKTYTIEVTRANAKLTTPTFTPNSGAIALGVTTIQIDSDAGSTIHYTTDGSDPTTSSPSIATGGTIILTGIANSIKALAVRSGSVDSDIGTSGSYTQAVSNNASNIVLSGSPTGYTFSAGTYTYTGVAVDNSISSVTVTPTAAAGTITVDGVTVASGNASDAIDLVAGVARTIIVVVSEVGKTSVTYTIEITRPLSDLKTITAFTIPNQVGVTTINEGAHTITLTMPYGTDLTSLTPTITITGVSVSPNTGVSHNFSTAHTYTVTAENSTTQNYTVTVNLEAGFTLNIIDNTTGEDLSTGSFSLVLHSQPTADVTIPLSSSDTSEGTIAVTELVFTSLNWSTPQTVTVMGVNDFVADGPISYNIVTGDPSSADSIYNAFGAGDIADIAMINQDDDPPGIDVTPLDSYTTTEAGGTARFNIVLLSQPTNDVSIAISSSDTSEGTVSTASLTFTDANWNTPQTVTVTGVNDSTQDGNITYQLVTGNAVSADPVYNGLTIADVTLTNTDNDYVLTYTAGANGSIVGTTPQTVNSGGNGGAVTATPDSGYIFSTWSDGVLTASRTDTNVTTNKSVTATFVADTFTVTFNKNGGDTDASPTTKTADYGENVGTLPTAPTRSGYTFSHWNTASNGSGTTFTATTVVTGSITVYAQWIMIPTFSPNSGAIALGVTPITITSTSGSTIYYTTDGTTPSLSSPSISSGSTITLSSVANPIKAFAVKSGYANSAVGTSGTYTQSASNNASNIVLSGSPTGYTFVAGTYSYTGVVVLNAVSSITVTPTVVAGTITVDGTTVTSGLASSPISLTAGVAKTITIVVTETGKTSKTYTISVTRNNGAQATPTFSPVAGAIAFGNVTITSAGADLIHYTTNGVDPTVASPSISSGGTVTISSTVTLKALAVKAGYDNSAIGSASYTQAVSANLSGLALSDVILSPTFAGGTYSYTSTVAGSVATTKVTATGAGVIQMSVNGGASTTISSGIQSTDALALTGGGTSIVLVSVTETGKATRTYSISIYREAPLAVGGTYEGGKIAYILQPADQGYVAGQTKGLIVPTSDQSSGIYWHSVMSDTTGASGSAIGTGNTNTNKIVAVYGTENNAAKLCYDYTSSSGGFYSDWYLPSLLEMRNIFLNRSSFGGLPDVNGYWTSTEAAYNAAYYIMPNSPNTNYSIGKPDTSLGVRCARSFNQNVSNNLMDLAVSDVILSPVFSGGTYIYTSPAVSNLLSTTRVTATGNGVLEMSVNGGASTTISSGIQSGDITLTAGATTTILISTTETGKATTTYAVGVFRNVTSAAVGDLYKGGKIAYILQSGDPGYVAGQTHGFIAALSNQSAAVAFGCRGTTISGADGTALGTGYQNTLDIVAGCPGYGASIARAYTGGGYTDWYLPSKDESYKLYLNGTAIGGFVSQYYLTSSEVSDVYAWRQHMGLGTQFAYYKDTQLYVRAIRSF